MGISNPAIVNHMNYPGITPHLNRAIADKVVVFLTKLGMEPTKTYLPPMSHTDHLSSPYQNLLGKDEFHR